MATRGPAPVDTGVTPVVTRPVDRAPAPVPPGPGSTGQIPTVKKPAGPPEAAAPAVTPNAGIAVPPVSTPQGPPETVPPAVTPGPATGQSTSANVTPTVPVQELPVDTPNVDAGNNVIPNISYIQVLANGTVVVSRTTALNFAGSGVTVTGSNGAATITISGSSYGNSNVVTLLSAFGSNTVSTTGNISGGYLFGNGSQLTGLPDTYGNANVVANLAALGSNPVSTTGNVTGGNVLTGGIISATGNIFGGNAVFTGNLSVAGNVTYINSNVITINDLAINLANNAANISLINGGGIELGPQGTPYVTFLYNTSANTFTSNVGLSAVANITGGNVLTGGLISATSTITSAANITGGNVLTAGLISAGGNITGNNFYVNSDLLSSAAQAALYVDGGITTGQLLTKAGLFAWSYPSVNTPSYSDFATIDTNSAYPNEYPYIKLRRNYALSGAQTNNYIGGITFVANYSTETTISEIKSKITGGSTSSGSLEFYTSTGSTSNLALTINESQNISATANITAGNLLTGGLISASGNVTGGNLITSAAISAASVSASGNITAGNLNAAGLSLSSNVVSALNVTGAIAGANVTTPGLISATANVTAGNILTGGIISATGNVSGNYFIGNGSQLTGIAASYGNANVATFLAAYGSNTISTSGNITAGNLIGNISITGNVTGTSANVSLVAGSYTTTFDNTGNAVFANGTVSVTTLTATGNITGNYILGNGSQLTGIAASYGNANVVANLAALGSNPVSTTGNVSAGYLFGNGSQLTGIAASGNTGNVTFSDQVVMGTGSTDGDGGLYLAPGNASIANSAVQYLRVRGGDVVTHIHLDTGNNQYYDQYFGDDGKYVKLANTGNVVIGSDDAVGNSAQWTFGTSGNLTLPRGGVVYETNIPDGGLNGNTIALKPSGGTNADQQLLIYPTTNDANHLHLTTGNLYSTELFLGDDNLYVKLANTGNIVVNSNDGTGNTAQWTFGGDGSLTFPGNLVIAGNTSVFGIDAALLQTTDNRPLIALSSGANGAVSSLWVEDIGNVGTSNIAAVYANPTVGSKIVRIAVGQNGGNTGPNLWDFGATGNLTVPGNIIMTTGIVGSGASPAPYLSGFSSVSAITVSASGNISATGNATSGNVLTGGLISATGNITGGNLITSAAISAASVSASGNITGGNLNAAGLSLSSNVVSALNVTGAIAGANVTTPGLISATGNITGGNVLGGANVNATTHTGTTVSVTGNITAANFFGNGNTLSNVATRFESSWIVPVGNSTQSFTVAASETYYLWVDCNIPNGILAWNATATVTNTNVPVVGAQYAWVYNGGGSPIDFTSIPDQFVGTANTILRSNVSPSATTNRFDFGLNNTSGGNVTVRYGWVAIS